MTTPIKNLQELERVVQAEYKASPFTLPTPLLSRFGWARQVSEKGVPKLIYVGDEEQRLANSHQLQENAKQTLLKDHNYLHASDRALLHWLTNTDNETVNTKISEGRIAFNQVALEGIISRTQRFRSAGIPGIFTAQREGTSTQGHVDYGLRHHRFPTVDSIINILASFTREGLPQGYGTPTTPSRVQLFANYALQDARTAILVGKELVARVRDIYKDRFQDSETRAQVLGHISNVYAELVSELSSIANEVPHKTLQPHEDDALAIANKRFFFVQYDAQDTQRILREYWRSFEREQKATFAEDDLTFIPTNGYDNAAVLSEVFPGQRSRILTSPKNGKARFNPDGCVRTGLRTGNYDLLTERVLKASRPESERAITHHVEGLLRQHPSYDVLCAKQPALSSMLCMTQTQYGLLREYIDKGVVSLLDEHDEPSFFDLLDKSKGKLLYGKPHINRAVSNRLVNILEEQVNGYANMTALELANALGQSRYIGIVAHRAIKDQERTFYSSLGRALRPQLKSHHDDS